eukprot:TRINITY_DN9772_c0_g1_i1.p1 TRINITY_DN9772_c0_g1~~TRINITY_DN9772_c0_g1_i1.p1  ORF type:complete len:694 (-),score=147.34 TRINITY_DN9772_c0_g1_i1:62-1930(-)
MTSLLDLRWHPSSLPHFQPLHMCARPQTSSSSQSSGSSSTARARPTLIVSMVREPQHEILETLGGGSLQGTELRVHGILPSRPLPEAVEDALVAVCPDWSSEISVDSSRLQIPVVTYFYDQRQDLSTFMDSYFRDGAALAGPKCFLTPMASMSRVPNWGQFLMAFMASSASLKNLSLLVFEQGGSRVDADTPLGGHLLGFATLDASALLASSDASSGSKPRTKSFLVDLRLLEAPGAATSLELEARVWPSQALVQQQQQQQQQQPIQETEKTDVKTTAPRSAPPVPPVPLPVESTQASSRIMQSVRSENTSDYRLNQELSVQLAKEFNLRAAALKRAGEEVVALRRQIQLLKNENSRLKSQIEDEDNLAVDARYQQLPEGLESLGSAELAFRLQRTLEKYREEKAKNAELLRRLEESLKEANRCRGIERRWDELEQVHLEQNRELQRLQEHGKKLETYRQTTRTQEKVISKLEKILESSLLEVQKAQKAQVEVERMKTENIRLRDKFAQLAARKRSDNSSEEELRRKDLEIQRLQEAASQKAWQASAGPGDTQRLDLETKRQEWEQRCQQAENRVQSLQQQLSESSKRYGAEISNLQVENAKKDARIKELEFLAENSQRSSG